MDDLRNNSHFQADYEKLKHVRLNPARHAATTRKMLEAELVLDEGPALSATGEPVIEISAGGALVRESPTDTELLVVKVRSSGYELPKGHLEWDETPEKAAGRELREETGLISAVEAGDPLGILEYTFPKDGVTITKRVHYFLFTAAGPGPITFTEKPPRTKEVRWITKTEAQTIPLVSEDIRPVILKAFDSNAVRPSQ